MTGGSLCLVTGATGAVGQALVEVLDQQGFGILALVRRPQSSFRTRVEVVLGDIADFEKVRQAMTDIDLVFHLAAKLHIPNPTEQMRAEYQKVNVEGTRLLVEAAQAASVRRLVFFSTVSVYGPTGMEPVDEMAAPHPDTIYADTKLGAEEIVLSAKNSSGDPLGVVLRMAAVYGPRMKGNYVSLANALANGRFLPLGSGANLRTLVYDKDAARAAILAAEHPAAAGQVYNVSDGTVHSLNEIVAAICEALGRCPPSASIPIFPARAAARAADAALSIAGRPPRISAMIDKLTESVAVSSDRIQRELGFAPEYDLRRGWLETISAIMPEMGRKR